MKYVLVKFYHTIAVIFPAIIMIFESFELVGIAENLKTAQHIAVIFLGAVCSISSIWFNQVCLGDKCPNFLKNKNSET